MLRELPKDYIIEVCPQGENMIRVVFIWAPRTQDPGPRTQDNEFLIFCLVTKRSWVLGSSPVTARATQDPGPVTQDRGTHVAGFVGRGAKMPVRLFRRTPPDAERMRCSIVCPRAYRCLSTFHAFSCAVTSVLGVQASSAYLVCRSNSACCCTYSGARGLSSLSCSRQAGCPSPSGSDETRARPSRSGAASPW